MQYLTLAPSYEHMYHRSLGCQAALFIPCMYGGKSGGSRAFDLLPGTLLRPLSCGGKWITHPCLASLPTLVWTCLHARGHTDAHMHTVACRYLMCIWKTQTRTVWAGMNWDVHAVRGRLWPAGPLQVSSRSRSANETFLPLDLSAGVPLNSAYIPSVHPAPLCAPLCSPALNFCQRIH